MVIVFDIGISKMRVAHYADGVLRTPLRRSTPRSFSEGYALLASLMRDAALDEDCVEIVGGVPGMLAADGSRIAVSERLPNWAGKPLAYLLSQEFHVPVTLVPAVALAAQGELTRGAGVGAGVIGHISVGATVTAATVVRDGPVVAYQHDHSDDAFGVLAALIGGDAVATRYGMPAYELSPAHEVWRTSPDYLAHGIVALMHHVQPERVVLSGAMMLGEPRISIPETIHAVHRLTGSDTCPPILPSTLGDDGVLYGAIARVHDA